VLRGVVRLVLAVVSPLGLVLMLAPVEAAATGVWRPPVVLVPHPAGMPGTAAEHGSDGLVHGFTRDKGGTVLYLRGAGAVWRRTPTPYRGDVLDSATEAGASYVLFAPTSRAGSIAPIFLGVRTTTGRYLPARQIVGEGQPDSNGLGTARLLVRNGHWWVIWSYYVYGRLYAWGGLVLKTDTAPAREIYSRAVPSPDPMSFSGFTAVWRADGHAARDIARSDRTPADFALVARQKITEFEPRFHDRLAAHGIRLRNDDAMVGEMRLQDLLENETARLLLGLLRLAAQPRGLATVWREVSATMARIHGAAATTRPCVASVTT
jgi:hypothetical protein